jgi:AbrB family looped-hinge helix DNA binding protein
MALVKVGPKRQITIPKPVFEALRLEVGDLLEVRVRNGKAMITPQQVAKKAPAAKLSPKEQRLLKLAKRKIATIQKDLRRAKGLTRAEADIAAKAGLIAWDQRWWWTEEWQVGEREAQRDLDEGRVETFESAEAFPIYL